MSIPVKIENMVSAITLDQEIDLPKFVKKVKGVEYNPNKFPGAIFRVREPKLAMLIFSSGKVICTGARSKKDISAAVDHLKKKLKEGGVKIKKEPIVEVQNIVASSDVGMKVNLDTIAMQCWNTEYEPEQFPGLVYRLDDPKTVMLIFRSGRMIITGAKDPKNIKQAAEKTREMIQSYDAVIE
ncbi:MAG: TATA-box-binding protein [Candidatus Altiarchaeales archaeon]|nr:TATA-box-binding protein [Candidatus Altiarchaeales archaeon]